MFLFNKTEGQKGFRTRKETEIKVEYSKIAETLGKFSKMRVKNDSGDKSGNYGSRG